MDKIQWTKSNGHVEINQEKFHTGALEQKRVNSLYFKIYNKKSTYYMVKDKVVAPRTK